MPIELFGLLMPLSCIYVYWERRRLRQDACRRWGTTLMASGVLLPAGAGVSTAPVRVYAFPMPDERVVGCWPGPRLACRTYMEAWSERAPNAAMSREVKNGEFIGGIVSF
ncbi:hypothetical protein EV126DRAFT_415644 [Verticillium dahliae]|nr:hypothetical protein EV126DRAFT_415644 [Verticillium dahliae]